MKAFCRAGNLSALLKDTSLPEALKPYATRLQALHEPAPPVKKKLSNSTLEPIETRILSLLTEYLNKEKVDGCLWILPEEWCKRTKTENRGCSPLNPRAIFYKSIQHIDVTFSTFTENPNNSFISFKSQECKDDCFGRIFSIFVHRRSPKSSQNVVDTWLHVQKFPPLPSKSYDPMLQAKAPDVQVYLRAWGPTQNVVIKLEEVVSHCSWIMYKSHELRRDLNFPTVALVSMER